MESKKEIDSGEFVLECVNCKREIDSENESYEAGISLGEYWCLPCAEQERRIQISDGV